MPRSFAPLLGVQPKTLILGSMPSLTSLEKQEYYANPNNAFWWIVGRIYGFASELSYLERISKLTDSGVAVWDVLSECMRPGSLDSKIVRSSEQANSFQNFFENHPSVKLIAFNGAAAKQIFMRHCAQILDTYPKLEWVQLPSSSPAHAAVTRAQKLEAWRNSLTAAI